MTNRVRTSITAQYQTKLSGLGVDSAWLEFGKNFWVSLVQWDFSQPIFGLRVIATVWNAVYVIVADTPTCCITLDALMLLVCLVFVIFFEQTDNRTDHPSQTVLCVCKKIDRRKCDSSMYDSTCSLNTWIVYQSQNIWHDQQWLRHEENQKQIRHLHCTVNNQCTVLPVLMTINRHSFCHWHCINIVVNEGFSLTAKVR